jgi:hypothetical protein
MVLNAAANQCERAIAGCCALPAKGHAAEQRYDRHLRNISALGRTGLGIEGYEDFIQAHKRPRHFT